jgi:hypothetical protein
MGAARLQTLGLWFLIPAIRFRAQTEAKAIQQSCHKKTRITYAVKDR